MLHPGRKLGDRYRLDTRIGAGGMGEVWRAVDEVLGRVVAVKAMLPAVADDPTFARRFLVEAKSMASVNHPAVASIHDYGHSDGITFLVMEFIDGESLSQVLARHGRLTPADTMRFVAQAADGLQAVHDCGIVHRDIKPANLLIRRNGSLLITDFGISRTGDGTHLTVSGAILGTPTYLSPEQVLGQPATALSDVYSLGLTAYECLAGQRPFQGDNPYAVALQRVQGAPRPLGGDVPRPVLDVIGRALAADPAHRWPSAAALADAARAAGHGAWMAAGHPPPPVPAPAGPAMAAPASPVSAAASVGSPWPVPAVAPAGPAPSAPGSGRPTTLRRRGLVAGALVATTLVAGVAVWQLTGTGDRRGGGQPAGADPTPAGSPVPAAQLRKAGLATCGAALCPAEPLCWGGLTSISGTAQPPRRTTCAGEHSWQTFSATWLPADAVDVPQDELLARADIGTACSASVMATRSANSAATVGWIREPWPVKLPGTETWIVYCMARPESGELSASVFLIF
ncbi:serine/threonine-protein kinase [Micromonospora echinofusca]|uniref:non-specific serine/threonine protein kinase n=1 Tax=Micromonospora echinofusca TaxID=47858 RepID=A0ABS3VP76_MICEH|nr:serine/threonine-protein kinase [Micromonospora echinofusca]MBO4206208.1 protein kinase [Micromonospora echinofusca]